MQFYTTYRKEFSQESTWRECLGGSVPLLVYNDPDYGTMDAPASSPAGSSVYRVVITKGIGDHVYGVRSTRTHSI
jgi:hypothetical protein